MRWIITVDHLTPLAEPMWFVRANMPPGFTKQMAEELPFEFQLFDDDDELYFSGKCGDLDTADCDAAFAPLDWAMDDSGCTCMKYRKQDALTWNVL